MNQTIGTITGIVAGIIGLALVAVLVSRNANTSGVLGAAGAALSGVIGAAVSPVTGNTSSGGIFGGGSGGILDGLRPGANPFSPSSFNPISLLSNSTFGGGVPF